MNEIRLIDANKLKETIKSPETWTTVPVKKHMCKIIDNAPTVEEQNWRFYYDHGFADAKKKYERPQGEYVDISKLRLMTVEECAGHTIDYAMGWKACVEWIKKGGAK